MAPHSRTLAWRIPGTEEPGRLQSMDGVTKSWTRLYFHFHFSLSCIGEGNSNPLHCSCLENPRDGGAWWAALYGVSQSRTRLKRLSSSSSSTCNQPGDSPGKNTGAGCHAILQRIFPTRDRTQVSILQADSSPSEPPGKPKNIGVGSLSPFQWIFQT